ncbi:hypothetical protein N7536_011837 [Penicillium majusculum]|uniref:Uncharacterized protein n=1 Tax=Penicillium solitum TaxID=60172 RepID=A0A1V6QH81_9EURO|nr:uncharacterized protein PENSOL_c070G05512 [Penicillium solitum]KAJ5680698.1 hypothetical protein N7536_011837 [Penicillium majusculum]OQD88580.1 hypothetical protein PENSOL_c070G05512 [Penicillium solitum]
MDTNPNFRRGGRLRSRQTFLPPNPARGNGMRLPGPWAIHIHKLPFRVARDGDILQGRYLNTLNAMPNQREPYLRPGISLTAQKFQRQMNDNLPRVEAALMQVVGQQNAPQCTRCLQQFGIFSQCVSVRNIGGLSACANCHWEEQDHCCEYMQPLATFPPPTAGPGPVNPRQDNASTTFPQNPTRNPFPFRSHTPRTEDSTAGDTITQPLQRLEIVRHLVGQTRLTRQSRGIERQLEGLRDQLTAANTATTTTDRPLQQIVDDILAAHRELDHGIWRNVYNTVQMMKSTRWAQS